MFDAELEDRQDEAVRKIQRKARSYIAKLRLIKLTRANYIKKYDRINDIFFYKNKTSGVILPDKPKCLGMDDLPDPRDFEAPPDYDAMDDPTAAAGFVLALINEDFPSSSGRLPDLPTSALEEFNELEDVLTHDFICKIPPENTYFIRNCKSSELKDTFHRMRLSCKKKHFFILYICTHILTVVKGDPKNTSENAYLAMSETVFTKPEDIVKTCVSLTDLTKWINEIPCKKKSVIINYAHVPISRPSFFAPVKSIYPPHDFCTRLADMTDSAVLASCVAGCSMSDALRQGPFKIKMQQGESDMSLVDKKQHESAKIKAKGQGVDSSAGGPEPRGKSEGKNEDAEPTEAIEDTADVNASAKVRARTPGNSEKNMKLSNDHQQEGGREHEPPHDDDDDDEEDLRDFDNEDFQTALGGGFNHHAHLHDRHKKKVVPSNPTQLLVEEYLHYWRVPPDPPIHITQRPPRPLPTWTRDAENNNAFQVVLPTDKEIQLHKLNTILWKLKRIFRPPVNYFKEKYRMFLRRTLYAPKQHNLTLRNESLSLFGDALTRALRGEAHLMHKKQVSIKMIFDFIKTYIPKKLAEYKLASNKEFDQALSETLKIMALGDEDAEGWMTEEAFEAFKVSVEQQRKQIEAYSQSPMLFVPSKNAKASKNPLCARCGPPAAPEKPYVVRTGINEVALEWYNPEFDGVAPSRYILEMYSKTRVFHTWQVCPSPVDIKTTTFIVRDLPSGVGVQFRLKCCNSGGWSQYSAASQQVTPGDSLTPLPTAGRWRRIVRGGTSAILDILLARPLNRVEHIIGLRKVQSFIVQECGFKKLNVQLKTATAAIHGLLTFKHDPEIARLAFTLLGWCMHPNSPGLKKVRVYLKKMEIESICKDYQQNGLFRLDTAIMNGIAVLRTLMPAQGMPGAIPLPPEIDLPVEETTVDLNNDEEEERKAIEEDIRKEEERMKAEQEEKEFQERAAKVKADEEAKARADEMALKKAQKREREREREEKARKYK